MIERFLERLDKVRKSGKGYIACCPVHGDKNPSMSVTEKDGKVLCYCFSCGASGLEVADALGLPAGALFEAEFIKTGLSRKDRENLELDRMVVAIGSKIELEEMTYKDYKRLRLARERAKSLSELERAAS